MLPWLINEFHMYLHIVPRLKINPIHQHYHIELISVELPLFKLTLNNGVDIEISRPFPNKHCFSVMKHKGRKCKQGLLFKTEDDIVDFNSITKWRVNFDDKTEQIISHIVNYHIIGANRYKYDRLVSEDTSMWLGYSDTEYEDRTPLNTIHSEQPLMMLFDNCECHNSPFSSQIVDDNGLIIERVQCFDLPKLEVKRLGDLNDRNPTLDEAFYVNV